MASIPSEQPQRVAGLMNDIVNRVQEENRKVIADLQTKSDKHENDIEALKKKAAEHDEAITKLMEKETIETRAQQDPPK